MRLAWVTCRGARGHDDDEPLVVAQLEALDVGVAVVDWDDESVDWSAFDRVVLRTAWDYAERVEEFLAWARAVASVAELVNPLPVVEWNVDKAYLLELAEAGVPVIPTTVVPPGMSFEPPLEPFVVKPAIGAGARDASAYPLAVRDRAAEHVARLHGRPVAALVQPLVASVAEEGEWPLVFLHGRFSHAANKRVHLPEADGVGSLFAAERNTGYTPTPDQMAVASAALAHVSERFGVPTYARVDVVRADDGTAQVLEVELVEPSLFVAHGGPGAASRVAAALALGSAP